MPDTNDKGHDKLIDALQDAYAMEGQLIQVLSKQEQMSGIPPEFQAKIHEHLEQTKQHQTRVENCLQSYGEKPSGVKSAISSVTGNVQGMMGGARHDALVMNGRDDYVAENYEIATYSMIIAMARALGDETTAQACELNLRDEMMMAKWLERHIAQATLLSLMDDGVNISQGAIPMVSSQMQNFMEKTWTQAEQTA